MKKIVDVRTRRAHARDLDKAAREIIQTIGRSWIKLARICSEIRDGAYFKELGYEKFQDWLVERVGRHKSTVYVAMRARKELTGNVPAEVLDRMTLTNADLLSRVPTSRRPELIAAAVAETGRQFSETVSAAVPNLHEETLIHVEFWLARSVADVLERVLEKAMLLEETDSRTTALEAILAEYDVTHQEEASVPPELRNPCKESEP